MEKPSIVCGFLGGHNAAASNIGPQNHPNVVPDSGISQMTSAVNPITNRPPLLRRVSQSDPHLDIPHFVSANDKGFNSSLHHVLSGLFESSSTLTLNKRADNSFEVLNKETESMSDQQRKPSLSGTFDRNKSALELGAIKHLQGADGNQGGSGNSQSTLRKTSSVANYSLTDHQQSLNAATAPQQQQHLSFFGSHFWGGSPSHHHTSSTSNIPRIPEDEGLMMSFDSQPSTGSALDKQSSVPPSTTTSSAEPAKNAWMGVFRHGFFAKPVIRSDEENYRYIMALDR